MHSETQHLWDVVHFENRSGHGRTTCQRCGAGIIRVYTARSDADEMLLVGEDCALALRGVSRESLRAAELAVLGAAETERDRLRAAEREALAARNRARFADEIAALEAVTSCETASAYEQHRAERLARVILGFWGERLPAEDLAIVAAARRTIAIGEGGHLDAAPGARVTTRVTVHAVIRPSEEEQFRSMMRGFAPRWTYVFHAGGAVLVWRTSSGFIVPAPGLPAGERAAERGDEFDVTLTVKGHGAFRGVQQTSVTRVTLAKPKAPRARKARAAVAAE